jgi:hypothetical protein
MLDSDLPPKYIGLNSIPSIPLGLPIILEL